jgi:hypothetical protein
MTPERTIVCPRCGADITVTSDRAYYFSVHRGPDGRPVEMRVIDSGKLRHSCPMWTAAADPAEVDAVEDNLTPFYGT